MNYFNPVLFRKTFRDSLALLAASTCGIIVFVVVFAWAMINMGPELMQFLSKFQFLAKIFEVGLGIKVDGDFSVNIMLAVSFAHAMVMMMSWAVMISISTRVTVGESERGTADLLLTLPVSRTEVFVSTSLVWMVSAVLLAISPLIGIWISVLVLNPDETIVLSSFAGASINFFAFLLAIGGMSTLVGCIFDRRGPAIATVVGIGIFSVLINYVEPFISQISRIKFLSLMTYFRPVESVRSGVFPLFDFLIMLSIGMVCWAIGLMIYNRRDVPTA